MRYRVVKVMVIASILYLAGCLSRVSPVPSRPGASATAGADLPVAVEQVEELRTYRGGEEKVYRPRADEGLEGVTSLLAVLPQLNLQALCAYSEGDIARIRAEGDAAEMVFAQPVDIAIGQQIAAQDRDQIPTDERGYRVLRLTRALFVLQGEMAAHVLAQDDEGNWGCWAVQRDGKIDASWVDTARRALSSPQ